MHGTGYCKLYDVSCVSQFACVFLSMVGAEVIIALFLAWFLVFWIVTHSINPFILSFFDFLKHIMHSKGRADLRDSEPV